MQATKSTVHRPRYLLVSAGAVVAGLVAVGLRAGELGPRLPLGVAIAAFAAVALTTFLLAIGPEKRAARADVESDDADDGGDDEAERVRSHRERRLRELGVSDEAAAFLGGIPTVSIHELSLLIDRGCPPRLAVRILWPVE